MESHTAEPESITSVQLPLPVPSGLKDHKEKGAGEGASPKLDTLPAKPEYKRSSSSWYHSEGFIRSGAPFGLEVEWIVTVEFDHVCERSMERIVEEY